jgi:hypothetical protein
VNPVQFELEKEASYHLSDLTVGWRLYGLARRAGLKKLRVRLLPYNLYAGAAPVAALVN